MKYAGFGLLFLIFACGVVPGSAHAQTAVIPTEVWADFPEVRALDMSPDAKWIAMLMRRERGGDPELLLFETADAAGTMRAIQPEGVVPVSVRWASNQHLIVNFVYETEQGGRPVFLSRSASYHVETEEWVSLIRTRQRGARSGSEDLAAQLGIGSVINILPEQPNHVLISHLEEQGRPPNYYRVNLDTGRRSLVLRGSQRLGSFVWDADGNARGAQEFDARQNAIVFLSRLSPDDDWQEIGRQSASSRNNFGLLGFFDQDRPHIATIVANQEGENFSSVYELDIRNGQRTQAFGSPNHDAISALRSPRLADGTKLVGFTLSTPRGIEPFFVEQPFASLHEGLRQAFPDDNVSIQSVSEDFQTMLIFTNGPQNPGRWFLFRDNALAPLFSRAPEINPADLARKEVIAYRARDGLSVTGYVTLPAGDGPFPTIAMPHGGPWVRDTYGFDLWAQMLANRGYAVFQPNYRGSTGFGQEFWVAGDRRWGLEMQDDIDDGMKHLVDRGLADPDRLAIFGWSYGGYAAMVAATREDPIYNCSVAGAAVSDLTRIRGGLSGSRFLREFQRPTIAGVSPVELAHQVRMPMLLVHGDFDSVVPVEHSRRFASGLRDAGVHFEYIEIENMGHSPRSFEENMAWFPSLLSFLDNHCQLN